MPSRKKRNEEPERERPGEAQPASRRPLRRARDGQPTPSAPGPSLPTEPAPEPSPLVAEFAATEPFPLDPFQVEACAHLAEGRSVLVAAPTGTGKTVVADCAIWLAQRSGQRAIYTAPVKALSNQKYRDLRARHGDARVGLLTGDIVENPAAPILVMTTEIYRNMLLEGSRAARELPDDAGAPAGEASDVAELARRSRLDEELSGVGCVVFDEMHFIGDQERGPVWEEAIIHSPAHVIFVGLSATVSNADELRRWIERAHGPMGLVFHAERAVPLEHYYFFENRLRLTQDANGLRVERFDNIGGEAKLARMRNRGRRFTFGDDETNQQTNQQAQPKRDRRPYWKRPRGENPTRLQAEEQEEPQERPAPEPGEVLTALRAADLLPCLYFLPGRKAVEAAAIGAAGHLLVTPEQRARLHTEVQQWVKALPPDDQRLEQVGRLADLLPRGLGFHHAGLLPALKMWVETLFARGDLKAVFSTDTLALGINMPARCVVVGSLSKFDGEQMRLLTPNEYQQLTGRAGRRGMDVHGAAVIPYSPWDAFEPAFRSLTAPLLPVTSAFAIRYNTVLNLWRPHDMERLRRAVSMSLREFQRFDRKRQRNEDWHVKTYGKPPPQRHQEQTLGKAAAQELYATVYVLRALGYIDEDDELSVRGRLLRAIFHTSGIMVADLLLSGALDDLGPAEVAEVASWFTYDGDRLRNLQTLPNRLTAVRRQVWRTQRLVQELELTNGLTVTQAIEESFHSVALRWWRGTSLGGLLRNIDLAEGDLLVSLNQTIDLLQQLQGAVGQTVDARDLWQAKDRRQERELEMTRERLARLRPALGAAWRGMLRGSVALSRTIPSMTTPDAPVAPMAEDTDPKEAAQDRAEAPPDSELSRDETGD